MAVACRGRMYGYTFVALNHDKTKILFSDDFWYRTFPELDELANDLAEFVMDNGAVYNEENHCKEKFYGEWRPIVVVEEDEYDFFFDR